MQLRTRLGGALQLSYDFFTTSLRPPPPSENDWERLLPDNFLFSIALKLAQNKNKLHKALAIDPEIHPILTF